MQLELKNPLSVPSQPLKLLDDSGLTKRTILDFVELMHANQSARVSARSPASFLKQAVCAKAGQWSNRLPVVSFAEPVGHRHLSRGHEPMSTFPENGTRKLLLFEFRKLGSVPQRPELTFTHGDPRVSILFDVGVRSMVAGERPLHSAEIVVL